MKKIILLALVFLSLKGTAQVYQVLPQYGYQMPRVDAQLVLKIPSDTTNNKTGIARIGTVLYSGNGTYWTASGAGGSTDTTSLSDRIDLKLNAADTASLSSRIDGRLLPANNLADVTNTTTARTNLGAQATLVSGTNIKTINGSSVLGSGDLVISGGGGISDTIQAHCILKPSVDGSGNITWTFIDDTDHVPVFFDTIFFDGGRLTVGHPTVSKVLSFNVNLDESFAKIPLQVGPSVGLSSATIYMFRPALWAFSLVGNGTSTYTYNSNPPTLLQPYPSGGGAFSFAYDSTTGVITLTNIPYQDSDNEPYTLGIEIEGDYNYRVQRIWTGLSYRQMKFKLINNATNGVVTGAPATNTRIIVRGPVVATEISTSTSSTGNRDYPGFFMKNNGSYLPNLWVTATYLK